MLGITSSAADLIMVTLTSAMGRKRTFPTLCLGESSKGGPTGWTAFAFDTPSLVTKGGK